MKTKIYYLFLLLMFFLMSCERTSNVSESKIVGRNSGGSLFFETTIDGHDYIEKGHGVAHSGTCKKCKQERDSIVHVIIETIKEK